MASVDTTAPPPPATTVKPSELQQEKKGSSKLVVDVSLRVLLFATALVAVVVMVTSKQTKLIPVLPGIQLAFAAKFDQSPAFIYYVAALSVACLYSLITGALSVYGLMKPAGALLQLYFLILDAVVLGIVAAATGAAGGVGYIGYKGNSHTRWNKVCDSFDSFCHHLAASLFISLISCVTLLLLVWLSVYVLSKKITRG